MTGPFNKGSTHVHLPETTATTNGRNVGDGGTPAQGPFPCFDGMAFISDEPIAQWDYSISGWYASGFDNVGLVALTGNEFLWYTTAVPINPLVNTGTVGVPLYVQTGGMQMFYGKASVATDGTVTREGPTKAFTFPFSGGSVPLYDPVRGFPDINPAWPGTFGPTYFPQIGNGYTCWGNLLDVAPGGSFLFAGVYSDTAGIANQLQRQSPLPVGYPVIPVVTCDALFLVKWDGTQLVLSAEAQIGMEAAFLAAADATELYLNVITGSTLASVAGFSMTKTVTTGWNGGAAYIASGAVSALGWEWTGTTAFPTSYWTSRLQSACFCGGSILIAVVDYLEIDTVVFAGASAALAAGYLVTANASTLAMSAGVDITSRLVGTSGYPLITATYGGIPITGIQGGDLGTVTASPPFSVNGLGVVSTLLTGGASIFYGSSEATQSLTISLDRIGYDHALVQLQRGAGAWQSGVSDSAGSITLTPGQFLPTEMADVLGHSSLGFSRTYGGPATVVGISEFNGPPGNPFSYNAALMPSLSPFAGVGYWRPQRSYWTAGSPAEVFGALNVTSGVLPSVGLIYETKWGVLRADVGGVPTFDFLDTGTAATTSPFFPTTTFSMPPNYAALQSGAAGTYNLTGFGFRGVDTVFLNTIGSEYLYAHGSLAYVGGGIVTPNYTFAFEWDWVTPPFGIYPFILSGGDDGTPISNAVTLQNGQVVFAGQCAGGASSFWLYGGKLSTFTIPGIPGGAIARGSSSTTATGTRVRKPSGRVHLPDNDGTVTGNVNGSNLAGSGGTGLPPASPPPITPPPVVTPPPVTPPPSGGPTTGFITRAGNQLLLPNGLPWHYIGFGGYTWMGCGSPKPTIAQVNTLFARMRPASCFRLHNVRSAVAYAGGFVDANNAVSVDTDNMIQAAKANGQYVICVLLDYNGECSAPEGALSSNVSWLDPGNHSAWKTWVGDFVDHYANEPTVAMYEIINEPRGSAIGDARLEAFYAEMGSFVKGRCPQLVETGTYGSYYTGTPDSSADGTTVFQTINNQPSIDVANVHDYNGTNDPIVNAVNDAGNTGGKPLIVGEWNCSTNGWTDNSPGHCTPDFYSSSPSRSTPGVKALLDTFTSMPNLAGVNVWAWDPTVIGTAYETSVIYASQQIS